jgi:glycosyltransferase involved in cell wall biosynthesis
VDDPEHRTAGRPTVAIGVTQCWHRVPGGTATSVLDLVAELRSSGRVDLVGVAPRSSAPVPAGLEGVPVRHLPVGLPLLYDAWTWTGRPRWTGSVRGADLVHVTVPVTPPRDRVPMVATVHDVLPLTHPEWFTGRGASLMRRGLASIAERADLVLVPSEATRRECLAHGFDADRLRVVPWGSRPVAGPSEDETAKVLGRHGVDGEFLCFVGTAEPRKGLAVLAEALVSLGRSDLTLVVAGPTGWGDADAGRLAGVPGPVVRTGHVDRSELVALERAAAAVVLPSLAEGFGLPVLESLAAGAVVVTTGDTACGEVAGDAALRVPAGDADALAAAIARVLDDPTLAAGLRAAGPLRAGSFTWSAAADGVLAAYRDVLSGSNAGGRR